MATRLFAHGIYEQPKSMMILQRIILPLLVVHVVLATWSGYRAIVQVYSVDVIRGSQIVSVTPEMLARFATGPATLRAAATGRAQWLRTPPPKMREIPVVIEK